MIFQIIGYIGLVLLMLAVLLKGKNQRIIWATSSLLLIGYSIFIKDYIFILVNSWVFLINLIYIVKDKTNLKKKK